MRFDGRRPAEFDQTVLIVSTASNYAYRAQAKRLCGEIPGAAVAKAIELGYNQTLRRRRLCVRRQGHPHVIAVSPATKTPKLGTLGEYMTRNSACARCGILAGIALVLAAPAAAANLVPLRDAKFSYLCVDRDSIKVEATGWTMFGTTYCSGVYNGRPAEVLNYAVRCADFLSTGNITLQFYTVRWEPKQADRVDRLAVQLVCGG